MSGCSLATANRDQYCFNGPASAHLKLVSIVIILLTSAVGITSPVVLTHFFEGQPSYSRALLLIKCFAASVILSTSLVHVLPDTFATLADCRLASLHPWRDFPFSGFVTLIGVLLALLVDVAASSYAAAAADSKPQYTPMAELKDVSVSCHGHGGGEDEADEEERMVKLKQRLVSQVLEIGIIFQSVIIRVTMGMSQNQCTIRPLVAALAFHQIFEGLRPGGCIAQWLTDVNRSSNRSSVEIPQDFNNLTRLKTLRLPRNRLSGQIPDLNLPNLQLINPSPFLSLSLFRAAATTAATVVFDFRSGSGKIHQIPLPIQRCLQWKPHHS